MTDNTPDSAFVANYDDTDEDIVYAQKIMQLERLRLIEDPFKSSADPRYLYLGPEHLAIYRQVQGVVLKRRGLIVVTSDPGHGKTSLAQQVYTSYYLEKNMNICYIPRAAFKSIFAMLQTISSGFDKLEVPKERSYEAQLEVLKKKVTEAYRNKQNCVIILDDAQDMPKFGLNLIHELYNFDAGEKVIQQIIFGQTETLDLFETNKAVFSRIFSKPMINPLSLASAMNMVMYRLRTAGRNEPLIEDRAFSIMYEVSKGVPRDIVALCAQALDIVLERNLDLIDVTIMREAISKREASA